MQHFLQVSLVQRAQTLVFEHLTFLPDWLRSLLGDGVLGGVGMVLTFLPILFLFFLVVGFPEDVGYTARMAFVTDRYMHSLGLHGKSSLRFFWALAATSLRCWARASSNRNGRGF